jgi:hypothetical protein
LIAPLGLIALTTLEGHVITPTIIGRRLTLNPLLVFLALAFWTWMWGPMGALLAVPLSIIACGREPPTSVRGRQVARVNGTFAALNVLFREIRQFCIME